MIHVYKYGGDWKTAEGKEYTVKAICQTEKSDYLSKGWEGSLEEVKKPPVKKVAKNDNQG